MHVWVLYSYRSAFTRQEAFSDQICCSGEFNICDDPDREYGCPRCMRSPQWSLSWRAFELQWRMFKNAKSRSDLKTVSSISIPTIHILALTISHYPAFHSSATSRVLCAVASRLEKVIEECHPSTLPKQQQQQHNKLCQLPPNSGSGYHRLFIVDCLLCHFDCLLKQAACKLCFGPRLPSPLSLSTWVGAQDEKSSMEIAKRRISLLS